ncbi:hypothetical protein niasHS_007048 [Heterodera schachtii]|uniref:Uncharacterized protein n=1 Tax=Heterodera schachtii TaxID=97005 RepID=A0ABD2JFE5_HETSC
MRSNFAFFVIFGTIFLLFLLNETLAGGTSSKHKSRKSGAKRGFNVGKQRVTLASHFNRSKNAKRNAKRIAKRITGSSHGKLERVCFKGRVMQLSKHLRKHIKDLTSVHSHHSGKHNMICMIIKTMGQQEGPKVEEAAPPKTQIRWLDLW